VQRLPQVPGLPLPREPAQGPRDAPPGGLVPAAGLLEVGRGDRLEALLVIRLTTGVRPGEALGLRWPDLDLDARTVSVHTTLQKVDGEWKLLEPKTEDSVRVLALGELAVDSLKRHSTRQKAWKMKHRKDRAEQIPGLVFTTAWGGPVDDAKLRRTLRRLCESAEVPVIHPYACRHSAASLLLALKEPARVVADVLGHTTTRMLDVYQHSTQKLTADALGRLSALLQGGKPSGRA
jgi:integrase